MKNPNKTAFNLAKKLKAFREQSGSKSPSPNEEIQRREVCRQIDWIKFNDLIHQLEFAHESKRRSES